MTNSSDSNGRGRRGDLPGSSAIEVAPAASLGAGPKKAESFPPVDADLPASSKPIGSDKATSDRDAETEPWQPVPLTFPSTAIDASAGDFEVVDITKTQKAEETTRRVSERLELVLDTVNEAIWDWNLVTGEVFRSNRYYQLIGRRPEDDTHDFEFFKSTVDVSDLPHVLATIEAHIRGKAPVIDFVYRAALDTGEERWLHGRGAAVSRDAEGRAQRIVGTLSDVTLARQKADELEQVRRSLAESQEIAHLGSFEYVAATQKVFWSDEEFRIYGLSTDGPAPDYQDMLSRCIHPADRVLLDQTFNRATQAQSVYELEHRIVRPDGSVRWVYDRAHPIFNDQGELLRYVGATLDITDRKLAEDRLTRSLEQLRTATEGAGVGLWYWSMPANTLDWDDRCKELLALPPGEEPTLERFYAATHPDDRELVEKRVAAAVERRGDYLAEFRIVHPDGAVRWVSARGRVFANADGSLRAMSGIVIDITERILAAKRLTASEQSFRGFFENALVGAAQLDRNGRFIRVNKRFCELSGYSADELVGRLGPLDLDAADVAQTDQPRIARLLAGESYDVEKRSVRKNGEEIWVRVFAFPVFDESGEISFIASVVMDITERRMLSEKLRTMNAELEAKVEQRTHELQRTLTRLELATKAAEVGIWSWDFASGRLDWDERMCSFYETPQSVIESGLFFDFWLQRVHPDDRDQTVARLNESREKDQPGKFRFRIVPPGGQVRWLHTSWILKHDAEGRPIGMVGTNRDVTESQELQRRMTQARLAAEEASKFKSNFLTTMSHEIRTLTLPPKSGVLSPC